MKRKKMKLSKMNALAKLVTQAEGKKSEISIGNAREVIRILFELKALKKRFCE